MTRRLSLGSVSLTVGLLVVAAAWLLPVVILLNGALATSNADVFSLGIHPMTFQNFIDVWTETQLLRLFANSAVVTAISVVLVLVIGSLAGFGLALFPFKGSGVVQIFLLAGIMLAPAAIIIPMFNLVFRLGLLNSFASLIGPYTALGLPIAVLLFRNAFAAVPIELFQSARLDGANAFRIFRSIFLPLVKPTIMTVVIVQALLAWNEYLFALLFMTETQDQTVQLAFLSFQGQFLGSFPKQFAVMTLVMLPIVALFIVAQRSFVKGLTTGAVDK